MKKILLTTLTVSTIIFSGCSSKRYFEPSNTFSASAVSHSYNGKIIDLSRDGATLDNKSYIGKYGIKNINIGKGYRFLNENNKYILASNKEGILKVINKNRQDIKVSIPLHIPIVSATIKNGIILYILNNNTFGIYRLSDSKKLIESRSEQVFTIDTRAASPMFVGNLAVMPMLDGKLIIVDINNPENAKVVYISSQKDFNNVIYLSRVSNTMVSATLKRLITLGSMGKHEYRENISEVAIDKDKIYLFTKDGNILKLNTSLNLIANAKFKFAHYVVATAFNNKVYALDKEGSLIVLNSNLSKFKIYDIGTIDSPAFISGTKLYIDGEVIELSKLNYD